MLSSAATWSHPDLQQVRIDLRQSPTPQWRNRDTASVPKHAFPMASYEEGSVSGVYEEFTQVVEQQGVKTIFASFSGSKDAEVKSWSPDCVQAEPVVRGELKHVGEGCVFIY